MAAPRVRVVETPRPGGWPGVSYRVEVEREADDYRAPHCDDRVLHAPSECVYCDRLPVLQEARMRAGIPFSPNEANGWSGNVAVPAGKPHTHMGATYVPGVPVEPPRPLSRRAQRLLAWLRR